tara:strand:+ start:6150 stop:6329 length:180 start_codon:yes stop_codon:yes gene_type:complete
MKYDEVWVTEDGRELKVSEMEEDHVRAALNMLLRNQRVVGESSSESYYELLGESFKWGK